MLTPRNRKLEKSLLAYTKVNCKGIKDHNVKSETKTTRRKYCQLPAGHRSMNQLAHELRSTIDK